MAFSQRTHAYALNPTLPCPTLPLSPHVLSDSSIIPAAGRLCLKLPQEGPRARRRARRWSRIISLRNARWGRGAGARTAHRTSTSRHKVYSDSHVTAPCRSVASQEAGVGVFESIGAMEEREQRRRCRGQNEAGERGLLQEAADGIPRALAMTDGRVVQGAAEAWRGFLPLEHR